MSKDKCITCGEAGRVIVFTRKGLGFNPTKLRMCINHGGNGQNTIPQEEAERLLKRKQKR